MLSIVNANYKDEFKIVIEFNDKKEGEVDYTLIWDHDLKNKFREWGYI